MKDVLLTILFTLLFLLFCFSLYSLGYKRGVEHKRDNHVRELRIRSISPQQEKDCWREAVLEFENREAK